MKGVKLLLKNAFRSSWRQKAQIFGLSLLVMLVSLIMSVLAATTTRVLDANNQLLVQSNNRDAIMDVDTSIRLKNPTDGRPENENEKENEENYSYNYKLSENTPLTDNQHLYQQYILNQISLSETQSALSENINFDFTRTEGRMLTALQINGSNIKVKAVTKSDSTKDNGVDKLVISEGRNYENINEVVLGSSFAKSNNIEVGDIIRAQEDNYGNSFLVKDSNNNELKNDIENKNITEILSMGKYANMVWFEVVGIGASADFVTPLFDTTTVIPNVATEAIVYMTPENLGLIPANYIFEKLDSNGSILSTVEKTMYTYNVASARIVVTSDYDIESSYSIKFKDGMSDSKLDTIAKMYYYFAGIDREVKFFYDNYDNDYRFSGRISLFNKIIDGYKILAILLLLTVLSIATFALVLTTKKQVEAQSKQIGCLKSIGYKKREVVNNFIAVPLIVSVLGSIVGYLVSIFIENAAVGVFDNYFNIPFGEYSFNVWSFLAGILFLWLILTAISFGIGYFIIRHSPLRLLKGKSDKIMGKVAITIKKMNVRSGFNSRLRTALLTTSMGKMVGVSATMLVSTLLMTTTIIAPKVMEDNTRASFNGMNYENMVSYTQPIANNPFSFYRTYNPNPVDGWGTYQEVEKTYASTENKTQKGQTLYPTANKNIDWNKVINDLYSGNIDSSFYAFDVIDNNGSYWSQMSYLNWKNLSTTFLSAINDIEPDGMSSILIFDQLGAQWPDYTTLKNDIGNIKDSSEISLKEYAKKMLWFYKKYTNGFPLVYSPTVITSGKVDISKLESKLSNQFKDKKGTFYDSFDEVEKNVILNNKEAKLDIKLSSGDINPNDISNENIDNFTENDIKKINGALTLWIGATFEKRLGYIILETTYSRAPYFVQEYIKNAIIENKNYNIAFNTIPFDVENETLGTSLNVKYKTSVGKIEEANIFGINPNNNLVTLEDTSGNNLENKLFDQKSNLKPIIINQTIKTKTSLKSGDKISFKVLKDLLYDNKTKAPVDLDNVKFGIKDPLKEMRTQSSRAFYSQTSAFSNPGFLGIPASFDPVTIANNKISGTSALEATNQTEIHKAYSSGNVYIETINEDKEFEIVGIQDGYGQAQAWISNENANEIMGYNDIQAKMFTNWFVKEYGISNEMINFLGVDKEFESFIKKIIDSKNLQDKVVTSNFYEEFLNYVDNSNENSIWRKFNQIFNNLYPIFNYKYSPSKEMYDLTSGFSTSQRFADFSSQGLNGNYTFKQVDENCVPSETNTCEMVIDPNWFVEGFGIGTLSTMLPMEQTRQILGQITEVVNMVIIMFIVIALLVSTTIILLTTSLIIYENKQFIATMKTLGYSNRYVVRQILGMYILPILVMFIGGFIGGWFLFTLIADLLALYTTFVLPVVFYWWLPLTVFGVITAIYVVTFGSGWFNVSRIDPVVALKIDN